MTNAAKTPATHSKLTTLEGVNAAPAQTWNWLNINSAELTVPLAKEGDEPAPLPQWASAVRLASGSSAQGWLESSPSAFVATAQASSAEPEELFVTLGTTEKDPDLSVVALRAEPGATGSVRLLALGNQGGQAPQAPSSNTPQGEDRALVSTSGNAIRVLAEKDSHVTVDILVAKDAGAAHLQSLGATLEEGASLHVRVWLLGGTASDLAIACDLKGQGSRFTSELRYLAGNEETLDVSYDVRQLGRQTEALINASGVLTEGAKKTLRATIDLVRGCKGSEGTETETVLVAGEHVRNKTLPVILCSEDDVQGNHGATIGTLSEEQLDFLMSRGLSHHDIVELCAQAIIDDAASKLPAKATPAVVGWARKTRGKDAAIQAADAAALVYGTLCDEEQPKEVELL